MSTMPERSDQRPARQARISGTRQADGGGEDFGIESPWLNLSALKKRAASARPEGIFERTHEQDHQALDHHDHVAVDLRLGEGQFGAALVEQAEQHGGQHDADGMRAAHQRHGDADEAGAADETRARRRCCTPRISFTAIRPASAPEIAMVMMMMRSGLMPA